MSKFCIDKPALLIGEGREEELFLSALVKHLKLTASIQVAQYGGKSKLSAFLSDLRSQTTFPSLRALGITRDADSDYAAALSSVISAIQHAIYPDTLPVKYFILPKENSSGALEALVLEAASSTPAWTCVERFMECVEPKDTEPLLPTETDKRRLQAWLSTHSRPGLRLGEAAAAGKIPFDHHAFQPMTDFIKSLVSATENRSLHA